VGSIEHPLLQVKAMNLPEEGYALLLSWTLLSELHITLQNTYKDD